MGVVADGIWRKNCSCRLAEVFRGFQGSDERRTNIIRFARGEGDGRGREEGEIVGPPALEALLSRDVYF